MTESERISAYKTLIWITAIERHIQDGVDDGISIAEVQLEKIGGLIVSAMNSESWFERGNTVQHAQEIFDEFADMLGQTRRELIW